MIAADTAPRVRHIDPPEVVRLSDVACRYMAPERALELCRNLVCALRFAPDLDAASMIRAMIEHRRAMFDLAVHATRVDELVAALAESWRTR